MIKVVFLDAGTLLTPLKFENSIEAQIEYEAFEYTDSVDVPGRIRGAQIIITNKVKLAESHFQSSDQLRLVCVAAAGTDCVDLRAAEKHSVRVCNVPDYGSQSVAEHCIGVLFALRRQILPYNRAVIDGRWSASPHFCWHGPKIRDLAGSTLGIIGRGRIGEATAGLARAVGMKTFFAARTGKSPANDEMPWDDLLAASDVVSLHVPLSNATRGLVGESAFRQMKNDAVLINSGRGALVDAEALRRALYSGAIAGAAIDVLESEPPQANHPLLDPEVPNLLVTPHVAWASESAQNRLASRLVELISHEVATASESMSA
jgi:glycerate dehydrogenase